MHGIERICSFFSFWVSYSICILRVNRGDDIWSFPVWPKLSGCSRGKNLLKNQISYFKAPKSVSGKLGWSSLLSGRQLFLPKRSSSLPTNRLSFFKYHVSRAKGSHPLSKSRTGVVGPQTDGARAAAARNEKGGGLARVVSVAKNIPMICGFIRRDSYISKESSHRPWRTEPIRRGRSMTCRLALVLFEKSEKSRITHQAIHRPGNLFKKIPRRRPWLRTWIWWYDRIALLPPNKKRDLFLLTEIAGWVYQEKHGNNWT